MNIRNVTKDKHESELKPKLSVMRQQTGVRLLSTYNYLLMGSCWSRGSRRFVREYFKLLLWQWQRREKEKSKRAQHNTMDEACGDITAKCNSSSIKQRSLRNEKQHSSKGDRMPDVQLFGQQSDGWWSARRRLGAGDKWWVSQHAIVAATSYSNTEEKK